MKCNACDLGDFARDFVQALHLARVVSCLQLVEVTT